MTGMIDPAIFECSIWFKQPTQKQMHMCFNDKIMKQSSLTIGISYSSGVLETNCDCKAKNE